MKYEFTIYLDGDILDEYNSYLSFNMVDEDEINKFFNQFFEIEFMSKKVEYVDDLIIYRFKITKEKEKEVAALFNSDINQTILEEVPIFLN